MEGPTMTGSEEVGIGEAGIGGDPDPALGTVVAGLVPGTDVTAIALRVRPRGPGDLIASLAVALAQGPIETLGHSRHFVAFSIVSATGSCSL